MTGAFFWCTTFPFLCPLPCTVVLVTVEGKLFFPCLHDHKGPQRCNMHGRYGPCVNELSYTNIQYHIKGAACTYKFVSILEYIQLLLPLILTLTGEVLRQPCASSDTREDISPHLFTCLPWKGMTHTEDHAIHATHFV